MCPKDENANAVLKPNSYTYFDIHKRESRIEDKRGGKNRKEKKR